MRFERIDSNQATDVLIVQEEEDLRGLWASVLRAAGFEPHPLASIDALLEALLDLRQWRALVVDLGFRGPEATSFLDRLRADRIAIPILLTAWDPSLENSKPARAYEGLAFRPSPIEPADLVAAVLALPRPQAPRSPSQAFFQHTYEGVQREERESSSLLTAAAAARAEAAAGPPRASDPKAFREAQQAREIRRRLQPASLLQPPGFEIAARHVSSESGRGDFHDVIACHRDRFAVLVADVNAKGLSAAGALMLSRTVLRSVAPGAEDAGQLLVRAAGLIAPKLPPDICVSISCGLLDPSAGSVSVAIAGQFPPLLRSVAGGVPAVSTVDALGAAIGMLKESLFARTVRVAVATLGPGDQLVFCSAGLPAVRNRKNEEFGDRRICEAILANGETAGDMAEGLVNTALFYGRNVTVSDDITVLSVRRT